MDSIAQLIIRFENQLNQTSKHNHPPMTGIVHGCHYCTLYGNIFEHGVVTLANNQELKQKLLCLQDN